jgi:hypothetical protein
MVELWLYHLMVTDVIVPLMDDKVMAEWLKATYPELKILFTSGCPDAAIARHDVFEAGMAFLFAPKVRGMLDSMTDTAMLLKQTTAINQCFPVSHDINEKKSTHQ